MKKSVIIQESFDFDKAFFEKLSSTIINISLNGEDIPFQKIEFRYVQLRYSPKLNIILFVDDIPITKNSSNYKVTYKCYTCGSIKTICLLRFLSKKSLKCLACVQNPNYGGIGFNNHKRIKPLMTLKEMYARKNYDFEKESEEFKKKYNETHLSVELFYLYLPKIYQINDIILTDEIKQKIVYLPHEVSNNYTYYVNRISIDDKVETIGKVYLKCDICGKIHSVHKDNIMKKNPNCIKCQTCALTNTTFPIRKYKNTDLTYQSSIEKLFLDVCFNNNINVENGFAIPYYWDNNNHNYIPDFYLPDYNFIIELKSDNIYYKMQVKNGKMDAKKEAAINFANEHNMYYRFLFDNEINDFIEEVLMKEIV